MSPDPRLSEPTPNVDMLELLPQEVKRPVELKSRLTVTDGVYFKRPGIDPVQYSTPGAIWLETTEQQYQRDKYSKITWETFERAPWIERASMVLVRNLEKRPGQITLSQEHKEFIEARTLCIGFGVQEEHLLIGPGESARFRPDKLSLFVKSRGTPVHYEFVIFPE